MLHLVSQSGSNPISVIPRNRGDSEGRVSLFSQLMSSLVQNRLESERQDEEEEEEF
jgi:hypothetical protein